MSRLYDSEHTTFVQDLWTGGIGRRQGDDERAADAPLWKVIPDSFDALCSWLVVDRRSPPYNDPSRRHCVQYAPSLDAPCPAFTFKVQGVLQQLQIGALGSWNHREVTAHKATRSLTLSSGGCDAPFETQRQFLQHLKEFVIRTLDPSINDVPTDVRPTLYFRDNVFTRVRPGVTATPLSAMDDPHGHAARIASRWAVTRKIALKSVLPTGRLAQASALQFHLGDFVEVEAFPDIVTTYQDHKLKVEVYFVPASVTRLCSAAEATSRGRVRFLHLASAKPVAPATIPATASSSLFPVDGPSSGDAAALEEWRADLQATYLRSAQ